MVLPRAITGGAPLSLGGRRWWLRITYGVLLACEEESGADMLRASVDVTRPSARLLRVLLGAALRAAWAEWSSRDVGAMLNLRTLGRAHQAVMDAWVSSMPEPQEAKGQGAAGPSPPRPATWLEVWASVRQELGLRDDEWLDMTPRQLAALKRVRLERLQREEFLVGILASTTANFGARAPQRALKAEAFMLHRFEEPEQGPVTGEQIMAVLAPIRSALGKAS